MRLTGFNVDLLPLRQRKEQVKDLINYFFKKKKIEISASTLEDLNRKATSFYWQGNIRQLFKVLDLLIVNCSLSEIEISADLLPVFKTMLAPSDAQASSDISSSPFHNKRLEGAVSSTPEPCSLARLEGFLKDPSNYQEVLAQIEKAMIKGNIKAR